MRPQATDDCSAETPAPANALLHRVVRTAATITLACACVFLLTFHSSCLYHVPAPDIEGKDIRLTLIHTSDIHSRILPYDHDPLYTEITLGLLPGRGPYGGIARIAHVVKREREKAGRSLYLDSGDLFQGAPIFNHFRGEPEIRGLSQAGLDVFALGNHEFDFGAENLVEQFEQWADFPVLAANYEFERQSQPFVGAFENLIKPFSLFNVDGLKVGVIGMGNLSSLTSLQEGGNSHGIIAFETLQTIQDHVNLLRPSVDVLILVGHIGLTEDQVIARNVCGIDIIMGGHHHVALNPPKLIPYDPDGEFVFGGSENDEDYLGEGEHTPMLGDCPDEWRRDTILAHPSAFAKFVARIDVIVRDGRIRSHKFELFPIDNTVPEDPDLKWLLDDYIEELNREFDLDRVVARAKVPLTRFGSTGGDSALGNFVAEAMQYRQFVETDFCITNSLGVRTDILAGDITLEQLYNVLPFDNTISTLYVTGKEVQEVLDFSTARSAERGCSSQIQVSNLSFTMNCRTGVAEDITIAGQPMQPDGVYEMCTNNYMANGGSGFRMLKRNTTREDTGISLRNAVIDYMRLSEELPTCYDEGVALEQCKSGLAIEDGRINNKF